MAEDLSRIDTGRMSASAKARLTTLSMPSNWDISSEKLLAHKPKVRVPRTDKLTFDKYGTVEASANALPQSGRCIADMPTLTGQPWSSEHIGLLERAKGPFTYTEHLGSQEADYYKRAKALERTKQAPALSLFQHPNDLGRGKTVVEKSKPEFVSVRYPIDKPLVIDHLQRPYDSWKMQRTHEWVRKPELLIKPRVLEV